MRYLVQVQELVTATFEVDARNIAEAESKAGDGDYIERDDWDKDIVAITGVERKAQR